jgi:hypothetical protein
MRQCTSGHFEDTPIGFIHIDLKHLPALQKRKSYAFVAIDRATRYVYLEIHPRRNAATAAGFLERFLAAFPAKVRTILTDGANVYRERQALTIVSHICLVSAAGRAECDRAPGSGSSHRWRAPPRGRAGPCTAPPHPRPSRQKRDRATA